MRWNLTYDQITETGDYDQTYINALNGLIYNNVFILKKQKWVQNIYWGSMLSKGTNMHF